MMLQRAQKWWITCLLIAAIALSVWLTIEKLTGRINSLAGCGTGSGCANVLGSKWSMVFGVIPVSLFSLAVYLGTLASLFFHHPLLHKLRCLAGWLFLWAAIWFITLQFIVMKTICPYCMTMHGIGILLGVSLLIIERQLAIKLMLLAACLVASMALIQHLGPEPATHRIDQSSQINFSAPPLPSTSVQGRIVTFFDGKKRYELKQLPHIGPTDAEHVIVKYFDYRCEACQQVHEDLHYIMESHPDQICVILIPAPLSHDCNPHLPKGVKDHAGSCELAELALKVWSANTEKFAEFHNTLFELGDLPPEAAEAMAYSLLGEEIMDSADPIWVKNTFQQSLEDYKALSSETSVMPKILLKNSSVMQGKASSRDAFKKLLIEQLGIK